MALHLTEHLDGGPGPPAVETHLAERLARQKGVILLDVGRAESAHPPLRKPEQQNERREPAEPPYADLFVEGDISLKRTPTNLRNLVVYEGRAHVRIRTADSSQVLTSTEARARGVRFTAPAAAASAAEALSKKLYRGLEGGLKRGCSAQRRFDLAVRLRGKTGTRAVAEAAEILKAVPGVESVEVPLQTADTAQFSLRSGLTPIALAEAIDGARAGVRIHAISGRRLEAELALGELLSVELIGLAFERSPGLPRRYRHLATDLPQHLGVGLGSLEIVQLPERFLVGRDQARAKKPGRLLLEGHLAGGDDRLSISVVLRSALTRRELLTWVASCPPRTVYGCATRLARRIERELPRMIVAQGALLGRSGVRVEAPRHVQVTAAEGFEALFPSLAGRYRRVPIGAVTLKNVGRRAVEDLVVQVRLEGLVRDSQRVEIGRLEPKESKRIAVQLPLDETRLRAHTRAQSFPLEVHSTYRIDDAHSRVREALPLMVLGRRTHRWDADHGLRIAAFVHHEGRRVRALARAASEAASASASASHPLILPIALFRALDGLRYRRDPAHPFDPETLDRVSFPEETLVEGGGDCDDLAVAYAALAEAAGWPAAFVLLPGHILPAIALPSSAARKVRRPRSKAFLHRRGRIWLPIETTQVGAHFRAAWDAAALQLAEAHAAGFTPQLIEVRRAWAQGFSPLPVEVPVGVTPALDKRALDPTRLGEELHHLPGARDSIPRSVPMAAPQGADGGSRPALRRRDLPNNEDLDKADSPASQSRAASSEP